MKPHKEQKRTKKRPFKIRFRSLTGLMLSLMLQNAAADGLIVGPSTAIANRSQRSLANDLPKPARGPVYRPDINITADAAGEPTGTLILPQALALVLTRNPELSTFSSEIRAREAAKLQAGLLPNPVFSAWGFNFGNNTVTGNGNNETKRYNGNLVSLRLSQLIELGGKRAARTEAAALNQELADWDYETKRVDVMTQVTQAFIAVLAAQRRLTLRRKLLDLSEQVAATVAAQAKAGKVSPVEATKAEVASASSRIEFARAQKELKAARNTLVASWGSTTPRFQAVAGNLDTIETPPTLNSLIDRMNDNPDVARWATEIHQRRALIAVEKSKSIPDVTVMVGANKFLNVGDYNMTASFSIPLQLFDRNQGNILAAERRLGKAHDERRNIEVQITTALTKIYQRLETAYDEVTTLRRDVLPGAQSVYDAAVLGYRRGKFNFLDVLDAQRTLFSVKGQYLQALTAYHLNVAGIERLIGGALKTAPQKSRE